MAQEEESFTFVDKRRVPTEEPVETQPVSDDGDAEALAETEEGGDIYGLLGYCVSLLSTVAWQKLGLLADPQTGEAKADLAQAKVAVDVVGEIAAHFEAAPAEAIPAEMRRELRTLVNDLRLNYVAQRGQ